MSSLILWRRLDRPGHEAARLIYEGLERFLDGTAIFLHRGRPCCLSYRVVCSADWQTGSALITGWVGDETVEIDIQADAARRWRLNGSEQPQIAGCLDLDLNFSPVTNLLPIRRLDLPVGRSAEATAAWLRFPGFNLEPLEQRYTRTAALEYRYESGGGQFVRDLTVDEAGFVTHYPDFWRVET